MIREPFSIEDALRQLPPARRARAAVRKFEPTERFLIEISFEEPGAIVTRWHRGRLTDLEALWDTFAAQLARNGLGCSCRFHADDGVVIHSPGSDEIIVVPEGDYTAYAAENDIPFYDIAQMFGFIWSDLREPPLDYVADKAWD
jgi:hypothetical protein